MSPRATVALFTYNAEPYLERILTALDGQDFEGGYEVLVIDSGSSDATLEIIARHPRVRLHEIPNAEFGHGRTRNLAAQLAEGEFVAYLTHDAVPMSSRWLSELLAPFAINPQVQAVLGKQVARAHAFPLQKYEIANTFHRLGPDSAVTIIDPRVLRARPEWREALAFYSDVNSAARRDFLRDEIPYRDVPYAEDQLFGQDVLDAGYWKAYAPLAAVEHSNDLTWTEYGARIFDETVGLRRIGFSIPEMGRLSMIRRIVRHSLGDTLRILLDRELGARKVLWLFANPFYQLRKWTSYRRAAQVDLRDDHSIARGSLEAQRRADYAAEPHLFAD